MFDADFFTNYQLVSAAAVPIVVALVQAVKLTDFLPNKFMPLLSIAFGIGIAFLLDSYFEGVRSSLLVGTMLGLSASGLYSGIRTTQHAVIEQRRAKQYKRNPY